MIIFLPIVIGILLIIWLQYPEIKNNDEKKPLPKYIFDFIKIPIIFTCIVVIIYLISCNKISNVSSINKKVLKVFKNINQKVYMGLPHF